MDKTSPTLIDTLRKNGFILRARQGLGIYRKIPFAKKCLVQIFEYTVSKLKPYRHKLNHLNIPHES